jgi:hypothetical protein
MKKLRILLLTGIFSLAAVSMFAQCKLKSGDVKVLKGQSTVNLQYDYSNMAVGKYKNEQDYVNDRVAEMNKKKAGSGDEWAEKRKTDRTARFQPMFEKNLNMEVDKFKVSFKENETEVKYTLIVRTTFTEPGFNAVVGGIRKNAYISLMCDIVESANPGVTIASIEMKNEQSVNMMGYDYDTGARIQSCYDRAGEDLGKFLAKNAFK